MGTNLSTTDYRLENVFRLIDDVGSNNYYFFVGDYLPHEVSGLQPLYDNTNNTVTQVWRNMIQGLQISNNNVYPVISNIQWTANTVYSRYDDMDPSLENEQFFAITLEGSWYHVWKCLDNNFGAPSTLAPSIGQVSGSNVHFLELTDGYFWKYMTSVPQAVASPFLTSKYFPIQANTQVQENAVPGAIDIFAIESNGAFYNNYVSGSFAASDIAVNGNPTLYNIANSVVSDVFDYYTGCLLYISSGTGKGQYANIIGYTSNSTGNILQIDQPFVIIPQNGTAYQVSPQVVMVSDGIQTSNVFAVAQVNSVASNSVYGIQVLQSGAGYQYVATANVVANAVVGISNTATIRPIMPPQGGHGSNVFSELYCNSVAFFTSLNGGQSGNLLATNDYQQIGIMYAPLFANVGMTLSSPNENYEAGEEIFAYIATQINSDVAVSNASSTITCNTANFNNQLRNGDYLLVGNQGNTVTQLIQVSNIINSTMFQANSNLFFACTQSILYSTEFYGSAVVTVGGETSITVTNCDPIFTSGTLIVGSESGAIAAVNSISRSGNTGTFAYFNNLIKLSSILQSGTFVEDETIQQGNNATLSVFDVSGVSNTITIYANELLNGPVITGQQVVGANSGAIANVSAVYPPDLIQQSGQILYIENINSVTRANTQTESFLVIFNF